MAQITRVTSEALQAKIRSLLPSQQGFGEDLEASNVITPVIDLTSTAEGSNVPTYQAQALNHGGVTTFSVGNTTSTLINTPGFFRCRGVYLTSYTSGAIFAITDGATSKTLFNLRGLSATAENDKILLEFEVLLRAGDSLTCANTSTSALVIGTTQQLADINGNVTLPTGFTPE